MNKQTYNWNAEEYSKASSEQQKWAAELLEKLDLKGDEQVLDIGCGDGRITAEIARRLPEGFLRSVLTVRKIRLLLLASFRRHYEGSQTRRQGGCKWAARAMRRSF